MHIPPLLSLLGTCKGFFLFKKSESGYGTLSRDINVELEVINRWKTSQISELTILCWRLESFKYADPDLWFNSHALNTNALL